MHSVRFPRQLHVPIPARQVVEPKQSPNSQDVLELRAPAPKRQRVAQPVPPPPDLTRRVQCREPMVVFDLETTGVKTSEARIVQFAGIKRYPDGREEVLCWQINPGMPIPPGATKVHKITDEDVKDSPKWAEVVGPIYRFMRDAPVWVGHNIQNYDVPLLRSELARQGYELPPMLQIDTWPLFAQVAKRKKKGTQGLPGEVDDHKLVTAYRYCTGLSLDGAHDALADARASQVVLDHLVASCPQLPNTPEKLAEYQAPRFN